MSSRDRYDGLDQGIPDLLPHSAGYGAPLVLADIVMPNLPAPIACLAKMASFRGEGNNQLDTFFDQIEKFAACPLRQVQDLSPGLDPL